MLSENSPCQKIITACFPTYNILEKTKYIEVANRLVVARGGGLWEGFEYDYKRAPCVHGTVWYFDFGDWIHESTCDQIA